MSILTYIGFSGVEIRQKFHAKIFEYYSNLAESNIPKTIVNSISWQIANEQHEFYKRAWKKYPKSRKRYSQFLIKDLNHPQVHDDIIHYLKTYHIDNFITYGSILIQMTPKEFIEYEKKREEFRDMF